MNMTVLRPSRKRPTPGDIFVYRIRGGDYGFGRVIRNDCHFGLERSTILIYIYDSFSPDKYSVPKLSKDRLLLFPILINQLPWSKGYFETVINRPLSNDDVHVPNCFEDPIWEPTKYVNEDRKELARRTRPCGLYALDSYRTVDAQISRALGIETAADTVPPARK